MPLRLTARTVEKADPERFQAMKRGEISAAPKYRAAMIELAGGEDALVEDAGEMI